MPVKRQQGPDEAVPPTVGAEEGYTTLTLSPCVVYALFSLQSDLHVETREQPIRKPTLIGHHRRWEVVVRRRWYQPPMYCMCLEYRGEYVLPLHVCWFISAGIASTSPHDHAQASCL